MKRILLILSALAIMQITACTKNGSQDKPSDDRLKIALEVPAESITSTTAKVVVDQNKVKRGCYMYSDSKYFNVTIEDILAQGVEFGSEITEIVLEDLKPDTKYKIIAAVEGEDGTKLLSNSPSFTTLKEEKQEYGDPAITMTIKETGADYIVVSVTSENAVSVAIACFEKGDNPRGMDYIYYYGIELEENQINTTAEIRYEGLTPSTSYNLYAAIKGHGSSFMTEGVPFKTN